MGLELRNSTFIITREDRAEDAKTLVTEGLRIGRQNDCDLVLNHPTVSRLHAGINRVGRRFYLINLSGSNATTLNGRVITFDETEALASGDQVRIGPFFLIIEQAADQLLKIRVSHQFAITVGDTEAREEAEGTQSPEEEETVEFVPRDVAGALKVFWDKRTREKAGRQSPLHPHNPPRLGKARFNWTPTRDLVRPWPFSIFVWGIIVVGALAAVAAYKYKNAFSPELVSDAHARSAFSLTPAIAREPNNNSCTTCHTVGISGQNRARMEANCASCHQTESFVATTTRAHREAGITCTICHTEHRGAAFRPMNAALDSCLLCHSDGNKKLYNGKGVSTPHGGGLGYPVRDGQWVWRGLDAEELVLKPEVARLRRPSDTEQQWRNKQFHALHLYRIRAVASIEGIKDEDAGGGMRVISCSSCHRSFSPIDRVTPRTTCIRCHNSQIFEPTSRSARSAESMSCTSCHVQHIRDTHWRPDLFAEAPPPPGLREGATVK